MGGLGSGNSDNMMLRSLLLVHHVWGFIVSTFFLSFVFLFMCPWRGLICACGARLGVFLSFFSIKADFFFVYFDWEWGGF